MVAGFIIKMDDLDIIFRVLVIPFLLSGICGAIVGQYMWSRYYGRYPKPFDKSPAFLGLFGIRSNWRDVYENRFGVFRDLFTFTGLSGKRFEESYLRKVKVDLFRKTKNKKLIGLERTYCNLYWLSVFFGNLLIIFVSIIILREIFF